MNTWVEPAAISPPEDFQRLVGGHPLVAQTLYRRGIRTLSAAQAFLDSTLYEPSHPHALPGIETAVARLLAAIENRETICVWGDFDVDGQTSTSVFVAALRHLNARVVYHIPVRELESHGVNQQVLAEILSSQRPGDPRAAHGWEDYFAPVSLLLTCDTGISSNAALDYARNQGVDVIVTDHHELPEELPLALALINPHLLAEGHPLATLPGVGVAYKLIEALYNRLWDAQTCAVHLDLVALGIVADLALQTGDTRFLLQRGLEVIRGSPRTGLQALLELAEIDPAHLNEQHIAFELAPRINALGRLGDANLGVELLTTRDVGQARLLATQLEILNNQRKLQTNQVLQGALAQIERDPGLSDRPAIILANPAWPAGVIGIVASHLVERYHKPVVLIAAPDGKVGRGSARSVEGINITQALHANAALLNNFGGHSMAAGFSIDPQRIADFRKGLNRALEGQAPGLKPRLQIDGFISLPELTLELVMDLERLAPFGAGNPPLVLACPELQMQSVTAVGREGEHLLVTVENQAGQTQQVIWWHGAGWPRPEGKFDLAFTARAVTFRSQQGVQLEWLDYRSVSQNLEISAANYSPEVHDFRQSAHPLGVIKSLAANEGLLVWAESEATSKLAAQGIPANIRTTLTSGESLAIWTPPPDPETLADVLAKVRPMHIYLFAVKPETDQLETFLNRLAGVVKHVIRKDKGRVSLAQLAGALAQRESTIRKGLAWMEASGMIASQEILIGELMLASGNLSDPSAMRKLSKEVEVLLAETRAYRTYFTRAGNIIPSLLNSRISA
jgi:single-stranded-DNA-specific exonuclease